MVTEVVQVIRDEASDRAAGVRTTAVVFGSGAAGWIGRSWDILRALFGLT